VIETPCGDDRFCRAALTGAPKGTYRFEDVAPPPTATKAGFGGSAAATVAAVLAGAGLAGRELGADELFACALAVHRRVQGGGSGIDVAASVHGGVLSFTSGMCRPLPSVEPVVIWSGRSARTGPRVQIYLQAPRYDFIDESRALVDAFGEDPIRAMREAARCLRAHADRIGLPYWIDAYDPVCALAASLGGAAKPSGAGGGDCMVALFPDPHTRQAFERELAGRSVRVIPVRISDGARLERAAEGP
jgi:phosphomevalonate kinase